MGKLASVKIIVISCIAYFILLILNSNFCFGQILKLGIKSGINFSELPNNTDYIIKNSNIIGYHFGFISEFRLSKSLFLQPGVLISTKGSKYTVGNDSVNNPSSFPDFQFTSLYAEIPLDLIYKFDIGSIQLLLYTGPKVGYGMKGKWETSFGTSSNIHFGNDPDDDLKAIDYGIDIGGGLEFGKFQFLSQFYWGLNTLSPWEPAIKEQKYKVVSFSVSYFWGNYMKYYKHYKSRRWNPYRINNGPRKNL